VAAIVGQSWSQVEGWGSGYHTKEVQIPPGRASAFVSLFGTSGGGTQYAGIVRFRRRLPDGSDQVIESGDWPNWPAAFTDPSISSITFGVATGRDQGAWALLRIDFWR
jgi:hypothetical protein